MIYSSVGILNELFFMIYSGKILFFTYKYILLNLKKLFLIFIFLKFKTSLCVKMLNALNKKDGLFKLSAREVL